VTTIAPNGIAYPDAICERGFLVVMQYVGTTGQIYQLTAAGVATLFTSISLSLGGGGGTYLVLKAVGDFSVFIGQENGVSSFTVQKYLNTAIVGVSQSTIPAGNAGTIIPYSMGPGGYPCNGVLGSVGKGFNHSATNVIGNTGTILGNSAAFAGIV